MMGLAVIVGVVISDPHYLLMYSSLDRLAFGFFTSFFLTASSMVLNDYADREIDKINEPRRPIPSGRMRPDVALRYGVFLGALGISCSLATGPLTFAIALLTFSIALLYNFKLKKSGILGNASVAYSVAIPIVYGSVLSFSLSEKVLIYSAMIFLSIMGREVVKGISDVEGDAAKGVRTAAVKYGEKSASYIALALFLAAISLSFIPPIEKMCNSAFYLPFVLITDGMLLFLSIKLVKKPDKKTAKEVKSKALIAMAFGLIGFALGSL